MGSSFKLEEEMIADTSCLINMMRGDNGAIEKSRKLEADGVPVCPTTTTVFELYVGAGHSKIYAEEKASVHFVI